MINFLLVLGALISGLYCIVLLGWGVLCALEGLYLFLLNLAVEEEEKQKKNK